MRTTNISFVVPAFNCESTIESSVYSIIETNLIIGDEVVIVNDASTDNTPIILEKLAAQCAEIKIITHRYNKGSAAAGRNTGIEHSTHDLIFCLDSDNVLAPNSIAPLCRYLLEQNADACAFGEICYFIKNPAEPTHKWVLDKEITFLSNINNQQNSPCPSGNYLFTKQSWIKAKRYDEGIGGAYDSWAFGVRQLGSGSKLVSMPNSCYYHRYGYDSTFVKENKLLPASLVCTRILLPFAHKFLSLTDLNYMLSEEHRNSWIENIDIRPLEGLLQGKPTKNLKPWKIKLLSILRFAKKELQS